MMRMTQFQPLLVYLVATVVLAYGVLVPDAAAAGFSRVTVGFGLMLVGATVAYVPESGRSRNAASAGITWLRRRSGLAASQRRGEA